MVFITLIPVRRNDGRRVSSREMNQIMGMIWKAFEGATIERGIEGHWVDIGEGRHYQDESVRVTVACANDRLREAEDLVVRIGRRLEQKAMYFEIRYFDGVRFLQTD